jgi:hypothetical protein
MIDVFASVQQQIQCGGIVPHAVTLEPRRSRKET